MSFLMDRCNTELDREMDTQINEVLERQATPGEGGKCDPWTARGCFSSWASSSSGEVAVFVLICLDIALLLYGAHLNGFHHQGIQWTSVCHGLLLVLFAVEAVSRIIGERLTPKPKRISDVAVDGSFLAMRKPITHLLYHFVLWDTLLVIFGIAGATLWGLHSVATILPSLLRLCRLTQFTSLRNRVSVLRPLGLLVSAITSSMNVIFFAMCLLLLNMVFFSVLAVGVLHPEITEQMQEDAVDRFGAHTVEDCHQAFSSLAASMSTLFALSTGDQWHDIAIPVTFFRPWALAMFMAHTIIASGIIVGLVYGALFQAMQRLTAQVAEMDEISKLKAKEAVMDELAVIFEDIDADKSGYITWQEFQHNRKNNQELVSIMNKLDLQESEILIIWDIMDASRDGTVSKEEFINFMWNLFFGKGKWPQLKTMHFAAQAHFRAEEVYKYANGLHDDLVVNRRLLEQVLARIKRLGKTIEGDDVETPRSPFSPRVQVQEPDDEPNVIEYIPTDSEGQSAQELMRGVNAEDVSHYHLDEVRTFWGGGAFVDKLSDREFNMSQPCERCDYFVSHCWTEPDGWYKHFQRYNKLESYGDMKAIELHNVLAGTFRLKRVLRQTLHGRNSIVNTTLWIDKCCIPQTDKKIKATCVALLEEFMKLSKGFIVIMTWQYFTRLWCVYEWACFLRTHSAASVEVGFDAFLKQDPNDTLPLYIASIEALSVRSSQCTYKRDHEILETKVFQYYNGLTPEESFASFERFAKCTAICLMAKHIVLWRARGSPSDEDAWLEPFRLLADRLGYEQLAKVLRRAKPAHWFKKCGRNQESFDNVVMFWFENDCVQYLIKERLRAVRQFPKRLSILDLQKLFGEKVTTSLEIQTMSRLSCGSIIASNDLQLAYSEEPSDECFCSKSNERDARMPHLLGRPPSTPTGDDQVAWAI